MREAWRNASRSDKLVGVGAPVVGLLAMIAGLSTSDLGTALFGAVALGTGLLFVIPFVRSGGRPRGRGQDPDET